MYELISVAWVECRAAQQSKRYFSLDKGAEKSFPPNKATEKSFPPDKGGLRGVAFKVNKPTPTLPYQGGRNKICLSYQRGSTLIEVMVSLVIIAIVSAIAIPSYQFLISKHRSSVVKQQLIRAIRYTRSQAVSYQQRVTLEGNPSWTTGYRVSIAGKVLKQLPSHVYNSQLRWQGFPDVDYLQFTPQGFTYHQNGTFSFYQQDKLRWQLVINKAGRVRAQE
jgi:type IV fimbrial biogenesis protein FimT